MTNLRETEGVGPVYADRLEAIGINSVEELLNEGAATKGREQVAEKSGLDYQQILEWVNRADLFRIKGVGSEYSDLLEFAGVDTVAELAQRNAANLTEKMAATDQKTDIVRRLPTEAEVADWIAQARALPRIVTYEARSGDFGKVSGTDLLEIEGVGPFYKEKLQAIGIDSVEELLEKGAHTADREDIAEKSGLTYQQILEWVNRADLFRIKGVGSEYSDLLETAGVDTVMELARRNPTNLTATMAATDARTDIVRRLPTEAEAADWVEQARALKRKVWYEGRTRRLATDEGAVRTEEAGVAVPVAALLTGAVVTGAGAILAGESLADAVAVKETTIVIVDPPVAEVVTIETVEPTEPIQPIEPVEAVPVVPTLDAVTTIAAIPVIAALAESPPVTPVAESPTMTPVAPVAEIPMAKTEEKRDAIVVPPLAATIPLAAAAIPVAAAFAMDTKKDEPEVAAPIMKPIPVVAPTPAPISAAIAPAEGGKSWPWLVGGLAILGGLAYLAWPKAPSAEPPAGAPVAVTTPAARPRNAAPVAVAAVGGNDILMLFDGGTKEWVEPAAAEFNKVNDGKIKIVLTQMGSREGRDHILYDKDKVHPVVWSPGDMYWMDKIKRDAADAAIPSKSGATTGEAKPLLKTYLTLLMPEAKARIFEAAMQKPEYAGKTWALMHDLATKGWIAAGGPADWGKLKLAQTDPTKSNSGMAALTLMYQEWAKINPRKSVNDKTFLAMMGDVEGTVTSFAPATSDLIQRFVSEPGKSDIAIVYESDAIRAIGSGAKGMKIVYPAPTVTVTVPAAVVEGAWVTADQGKMGQAFVDYLATDAVQEQAMMAGYRPANASLAAKVTETFGAKTSEGVAAAPLTGEEADTKTKEGLIFNWNEWFKKKGGA